MLSFLGQMITNSNPTSFAADMNALHTLDAFCNGIGTTCKHFQVHQHEPVMCIVLAIAATFCVLDTF